MTTRSCLTGLAVGVAFIVGVVGTILVWMLVGLPRSLGYLILAGIIGIVVGIVLSQTAEAVVKLPRRLRFERAWKLLHCEERLSTNAFLAGLQQVSGAGSVSLKDWMMVEWISDRACGIREYKLPAEEWLTSLLEAQDRGVHAMIAWWQSRPEPSIERVRYFGSFE